MITLEWMAACVNFSALYEYVFPSHEGAWQLRITSTAENGFYPLLFKRLLHVCLMFSKNSLTVAVCKTNYLQGARLNMRDIKAQNSTNYLTTLMQSQGNHSIPLKPKYECLICLRGNQG